MTLPWVSREAYEERGRLLVRCHVEHESLLARYHELVKLVQPAPKPELKPRADDQVIHAILARAGSDGRLRTHLGVWALGERRKRVPDEDIIQQIEHWHSDEEEGVPE